MKIKEIKVILNRWLLAKTVKNTRSDNMKKPILTLLGILILGLIFLSVSSIGSVLVQERAVPEELERAMSAGKIIPGMTTEQLERVAEAQGWASVAIWSVTGDRRLTFPPFVAEKGDPSLALTFRSSTQLEMEEAGLFIAYFGEDRLVSRVEKAERKDFVEGISLDDLF